MKYRSKQDIEPGTKLKLIREKISSYGTLQSGEIVILDSISHYPTRFHVTDSKDKSWDLFTYDFEELTEDIDLDE